MSTSQLFLQFIVLKNQGFDPYSTLHMFLITLHIKRKGDRLARPRKRFCFVSGVDNGGCSLSFPRSKETVSEAGARGVGIGTDGFILNCTFVGK